MMSSHFSGPRVECPYQINVGSKTLLKISATAFGKDFLFVGSSVGNGSKFVPDDLSVGLEGGVEIDFGDMYAAAILHKPSTSASAPEAPSLSPLLNRRLQALQGVVAADAAGRHIYYGWVKCNYILDSSSTFDSALSLPRDIDLELGLAGDGDGDGDSDGPGAGADAGAGIGAGGAAAAYTPTWDVSAEIDTLRIG